MSLVPVCSIYLPPSLKLNSSNLDDLITQLPPPVLLLGNFNAHSSLWGCPKTDIRGKLIEDLLHKHNLCLLNNGSTTYMHAATASVSAIDLSICSPNIFLDVQPNVHEDLCGSDRHPITIFYDLVNTIRYDTRCYFNVRSKADISQLNLPHGTDN